jgi:hypothetical protein
VSKLCDDTETGKQPTFQEKKCIMLTIQYGVFDNNIFMSERLIALSIKVYPIITAGSAT